MKISNSEIRAKAREALGGNIFGRTWIMSLVAVGVITLVINLASQISCGIGTFLVTGPLYVGLHIAFLKLARGEKDMEIGSVFDGCHNFGSNMVLGVMYTVHVMLWSLLFIIPGIVKSYSYSLIYYIKADHPEYGWRECLDESEKMMQGNKWRLFCLNFSFIGWILVGSLICGIGALWVSPYMQASTAVFYEELKREQGYYAEPDFASEPFTE